MKKFVLVFALFTAFFALSHMRILAQNGDAILGQWYTEDDKSIVEVWKSGNAYNGKILWVRDSLDEVGKLRLDKNNGNEALRKRTVVGMQILSSLKFQNGEWVDGSIYDPESGNNYSGKAAIKGNKLDLRGYILGIPFLGRTTTWRKKQ
jgi:uncharacterized protein (DUF2147 family)